MGGVGGGATPVPNGHGLGQSSLPGLCDPSGLFNIRKKLHWSFSSHALMWKLRKQWCHLPWHHISVLLASGAISQKVTRSWLILTYRLPTLLSFNISGVRLYQMTDIPRTCQLSGGAQVMKPAFHQIGSLMTLSSEMMPHGNRACQTRRRLTPTARQEP